MVYRNMALFKVAEVEAGTSSSSVAVRRFPKDVSRQLGLGHSTFGRYVATMTTGCELRFVVDGDRLAVSLGAVEADGEVLVFKGDFLHSRHPLPAGLVKTILLTETEPMKHANPALLRGGAFSPEVWRILFGHDFTGVFHGIETYGQAIRPPAPAEVPAVKWLAYGSSITHGAGALLHANSWIMQAAHALGVDVLDKGMGGSCFCEPEMADYLAESGARGEWDVATLELGVNMRSQFTPEAFEAHAGLLVRRIKELNPEKPVVLLTIFPNACTGDEQTVEGRNEKHFNQVIRELHHRYRNDKVHLIEGSEILNRSSLLSCDLIHPSPQGHIVMGHNMATRMPEILKTRVRV